MAEKDKRDEIISMQLDLIRQMTQNNIRRLSDDIWGASRNPQNPQAQNPQADAQNPRLSGQRTQNTSMVQNPQGSSGGAANSVKPPETKASDGGDGGKAPEKEEDLPQ